MKPSVLKNDILSALPRKARSALERCLISVSFIPGEIVQEAGNIIKYVYFPMSGIASLQIIMKDGEAVDTAMVGRESVLGPMAALRARKSLCRCIARTTLVAQRISAIHLRRVAADHVAVSRACIDYNDALLSRTQISVARYTHSLLDARIAACLLEASNLLESDTFPLEQSVIAGILSVRRPSITLAACKLRDAGLISYSRGTVRILDRVGLLARAC
jgi:CRP-like cAMP-binding protein